MSIKWVKIYAIPGSGSNFLEFIMAKNIYIKIMPDSSFMGSKHGHVVKDKIDWDPMSWIRPGGRMLDKDFQNMQKENVAKYKKELEQAFKNREIGHVFTNRSIYSWLSSGGHVHLNHVYGGLLLEVTMAWNDLSRNYMEFVKKNPDISFVATHKELIFQPHVVIKNICKHFNLNMKHDDILIPGCRIAPGPTIAIDDDAFISNSKYWPDYNEHILKWLPKIIYSSRPAYGNIISEINKLVSDDILKFYGFDKIEVK